MFIDYIEAELGPAVVTSNGREYNWDCPFCADRGETADTRKRFAFNEEKMIGQCFNCGWRGNAVTFVKDIRGIAWREALDTVNTYVDFRPLPTNIFDEVYERLFMDGYEMTHIKSPPQLPTDFTAIDATRSPLKDRYIEYARSRGVTDRQITKFRMGFCRTGEVAFANGKKTELNNHLFIQDIKGQAAVYWMARALSKKSIPKTFNPVSTNTILGKSDVVFNLETAKKTGVVVITEGVFDAMTVGDSGVALYGKMMSTQQYLALINSGVDTVYVMLDPDARKYAFEMAEKLSKVIDRVYFVDIDAGDPNEIGAAGCLRALAKAERFTPLNSIKLKLGGL